MRQWEASIRGCWWLTTEQKILPGNSYPGSKRAINLGTGLKRNSPVEEIFQLGPRSKPIQFCGFPPLSLGGTKPLVRCLKQPGGDPRAPRKWGPPSFPTNFWAAVEKGPSAGGVTHPPTS